MEYKDIVWSSVLERLDRAISYANCQKVDREQANGSGDRRYPYIPFHMGTFVDEMDTLRQLVQKRHPTFVDVGCGVGTKLAIASQFGFICHGIELDQELACIAREMSFKVENTDAIMVNYKPYDIIYFYCPIRDDRLEAKLERRIIDTAKSGALIVGNMKCGDDPGLRKRVWSSRKVELVCQGTGDGWGPLFEVHRKK